MRSSRALALAVVLAVLGAVPAAAQVAYVSSADNGSQQSTAAPSISSFNGGGSGEANRALTVCVGNTGANTTTAISYNGTPLTLLTSANAQTITIRCGCLAGPTSTGAINATMSGSVGNVWIVATLLSGADQTTPCGTALTNSGSANTTLTVTATLPASGMLVGFSYWRDNIGGLLTAGSGGTERIDKEEGSFGSTIGLITDTASNDVTWSWTGASAGMHAMVVPISQASGGGGGSATPTLLMMGVGQ